MLMINKRQVESQKANDLLQAICSPGQHAGGFAREQLVKRATFLLYNKKHAFACAVSLKPLIITKGKLLYLILTDVSASLNGKVCQTKDIFSCCSFFIRLRFSFLEETKKSSFSRAN